MKTLVVIDMQPNFKSACDIDTVIAVSNEIVSAKKNNFPVLFVEYKHKDCKKIHKGLIDLVGDYDKKFVVKKQRDDGSLEVIKAINMKNFPIKNLRVCGVNSDCCVWATVKGLLKSLDETQIEIVKKACNTDIDRNFSWRKYFRHKNLRLV